MIGAEKYKNIQIIIIDDEIHTGFAQKLLIRVLASLGVMSSCIYQYASYEEYLAAVKSKVQPLTRPIYFVDFNLKDNKFGDEVIREIRKRDGRIKVYIFGWSSDTDDRVKNAFLDSGVTKILEKKVNKEAMERNLQEALDYYTKTCPKKNCCCFPLSFFQRKISSRFSNETYFPPIEDEVGSSSKLTEHRPN